MQFERTTDYPLLAKLLQATSLRLYDFLSDDFSPERESVGGVPEHPAAWYILARDGDELLGFWMFTPDNGNAITWIFHTVMPLDGRALRAMQELLGPGGWLWRKSPCVRAVTAVPSFNAIARRFGQRAGLTEYGRNPRSYSKLGTLYDLILMGVSKEPTCQS